jgi:hypothetical protein
MSNKPKLTVSLAEKTENQGLATYVQWLMQNVQEIELEYLSCRNPNGSATYSKFDSSSKKFVFEEKDFKTSFYYQTLKQLGVSEKLIKVITAIIESDPKNLRYSGVQVSKDELIISLLRDLNLIFDELKLTTIEKDQATIEKDQVISKFTYTLKGTLFTYGEEQKTVKYIPFDEDMKNMGKSMGELIKTKEDNKNFIAGINETAAKDFEIKESSITSKLLTVATGFVLGVSGTYGYKYYYTRNNIAQNPNKIIPTSNQVVANDYYTSLAIAQQ